MSEMSVECVYSGWEYFEDFFSAFATPGNISGIRLARLEKLGIF